MQFKRICGITFAFLLVFSLLIDLIPSAFTAALAEPDRSPADYVTSLTVSPADVNSHDKVRISVAFSDGGSDEPVFSGGDTISIEWPSSGEAYLKGYRTTIPLVSPDGATYATVSVTSGGAVVTFNDNVNDMYEVDGSFFFEAIAMNATDTTEEDTKTVVVSAGSKTFEIHVTKGAEGGTGIGGDIPDFRKQADDIGGEWTKLDGIDGWVMTLDPDDPTYTRWMLTANENKHSVSSDITIRDVIGPGQALDRSTLTVYSAGRHNKNYSGTVEAVTAAFLADFPGSSLIFGADGGLTWVIEQSAADGEAWYMIYQCDITDFSLASFDNDADIFWNEPDGAVYSSHSGSHFANVDQGGNVGGLPRGVLRILKKAAGTDLALSGVVFAVDKQSGSDWERIGTMTTGSDGVATMTKLKSGHYRLYELTAPDYLEKEYTENAPYEFDIDTSDPAKQSLELTVENSVRSAEITAEKLWLTQDGAEDAGPHPTVYLRLFRTNASGRTTAVGAPKALADGVGSVSWGSLPLYDIYGGEYSYSVREVDADGNDFVPDGFEKEENGLTVTNTRIPEGSSEPESSSSSESLSESESSYSSENSSESESSSSSESSSESESSSSSESSSESSSGSESSSSSESSSESESSSSSESSSEPESSSSSESSSGSESSSLSESSSKHERSSSSASESSSESRHTGKKPAGPDTGDDSHLIIWAAISVFSLSALLLAVCAAIRYGEN